MDREYLASVLAGCGVSESCPGRFTKVNMGADRVIALVYLLVDGVSWQPHEFVYTKNEIKTYNNCLFFTLKSKVPYQERLYIDLLAQKMLTHEFDLDRVLI